MIELHLGGCKQNNRNRRFIMNLTQNDRLNQVTANTLIVELMLVPKLTFAEHLTGEDLNFPKEYLSLVIPERDF